MIMRSKTSKSFILQLVRIRRRVDQAAALPPSYSLVTRWEQHFYLVPCYVTLSCPLLCVIFLSPVICYFLVPCNVLLSCPLLCVTFLSLVMCYLLVPCYVLLSCPLSCVTLLSLVMCYFLVPCYVLLPCPLLFVTCCTSHSDGTYLGHQVVTCQVSHTLLGKLLPCPL